jgi:hypothetical protein
MLLNDLTLADVGTILWLADVGNIALVVQAVVVSISLVFIWRQLSEAVRLTKAANAQKLVELSSPFNLQLIQNPEVYKLWIKADDEWDKMDEINRGRHYELLTWWLILHENIYHQWQKRLLDEDTFNSWGRDLKHFLARKDIEQYRKRWEKIFEPSFVEHINKLYAAEEND